VIPFYSHRTTELSLTKNKRIYSIKAIACAFACAVVSSDDSEASLSHCTSGDVNSSAFVRGLIISNLRHGIEQALYA
jgi:hypothetical protein